MKKRMFVCLAFLAVFTSSALAQGDAERGGRIYALKCGRCHIAIAPAAYSLEGWKTILSDMGALASLDAAGEADIVAYLAQAAGTPGLGLPTSPVLSGYFYTELFSAEDIVDTFDIHYLNFSLAGRVHPIVSYKVEFELEHGGAAANPPFVEQAYMDVRVHNSFNIRIGAFLTPFNRFDEFHGPLDNRLVTRPYVSREIGVSAWKDVGIDLHGNIQLGSRFFLQYNAYAINGLGAGARLRGSRQYLDNNDAKSLGFRLSGVFNDRWEAGVSYYRGAWNTTGDMALTVAGLHLLGRLGDLGVFAEYARALSDNPIPYARGKADGWFVQLDYRLGRKFRPVFRYDSLDYLDPGNALGRKPADLMASTAALGLDFFLTPSIVFKVEYDFVHEGSRKPQVDNDLLSLQAAVRF